MHMTLLIPRGVGGRLFGESMNGGDFAILPFNSAFRNLFHKCFSLVISARNKGQNHHFCIFRYPKCFSVFHFLMF